MRKLVLLVLATCFLTLCKGAYSIELQAISTEIVKLADVGAVWGTVQKIPAARKDEIYFLKLNFSSKQDLLKLARSEAHFSFDANLCGSDKTPAMRLFVLPGLRIDNVPIEALLAPPSAGKEVPKWTEQTVYNVLVPLAGDELTRLLGGVSNIDRIPFFDLHASNENVCLRLRAGAMWFGAFAKSNIIMFPRAQLNGR